ncbi:hypothetical protein P0R31_00835 [Bradyrhizobium yuanmingense]|uniref:hypothetical protein n=1 Tax=Bradyrhizobium yuanmingense TaxID=108015 RepID=UPI0023B8F53B|nr:hypothetical protein [Bradyrhizobium yuanmingense]MDF0515784.1 hypothetical protein [Bradyrhizobium yuanmingense]
MNSMDTFDPDCACQVHDGFNDQMIEWRPQWAAMYREDGTTLDEGVVSWDGLLLDGWAAIVHRNPCGH